MFCLQASHLAFLKFHRGSGVEGVNSIRAGCSIIVGLPWDLGKLLPMEWVGLGVPFAGE